MTSMENQFKSFSLDVSICFDLFQCSGPGLDFPQGNLGARPKVPAAGGRAPQNLALAWKLPDL